MTERFFNLHRQSTPLILPNAWDAASAKIFEDLGASAIATSSAAVAWSLGYPDGGLLPPALQASLARQINRVLTVPLSVDIENGYSDDPAVVAENVKPLLDAGVAGINIEDGTDAPELLARKIDAIKTVVLSHGSSLFVNARTDVYLASLVAPESAVGEAVKRGALYAAAGADGLFVPVITNADEIARIAAAVSLPLNVMAMPGLLPAAKLGELGVRRLSAGTGVAAIAWQAAAEVAGAFLKGGDSAVFDGKGMSGGKLQGLFAVDGVVR